MMVKAHMGPVGGSEVLVPMRPSAGEQASKPPSNFGDLFFFLFFTKPRQHNKHYLTATPALPCRGCFRAARRGDMAHGWAPDLENPFRVT
jgi:hypothetical protein